MIKEEDLAGRAESYIRRSGKPLAFLGIRRHLGVSVDRSSELARLLKEDERFFRVGSLWYVRKAPLKIKVRFCPNCGYKRVRFEGGFYHCPNCEIRFHFTWLI